MRTRLCLVVLVFSLALLLAQPAAAAAAAEPLVSCATQTYVADGEAALTIATTIPVQSATLVIDLSAVGDGVEVPMALRGLSWRSFTVNLDDAMDCADPQKTADVFFYRVKVVADGQTSWYPDVLASGAVNARYLALRSPAAADTTTFGVWGDSQTESGLSLSTLTPNEAFWRINESMTTWRDAAQVQSSSPTDPSDSRINVACGVGDQVNVYAPLSAGEPWEFSFVGEQYDDTWKRYWAAQNLQSGGIPAILTPGNHEAMGQAGFSGWAVDGSDDLLRFDDEGRAWRRVDTATGSSLRAVAESNDTVCAVGDDNVIVVGSGGAVWSAYTGGVHEDLKGVALLEGQGWAVGDDSTILHSAHIDGGWGPCGSVPALAVDDFNAIAVDRGGRGCARRRRWRRRHDPPHRCCRGVL